MGNSWKAAAAALCLALLVRPSLAVDIEHRRVDVMSEGMRLAAYAYHPANPAGPLPLIVLSHGWGGTAAGLDFQARAFAEAGYYALALDYRGWGQSDARLVLDDLRPEARPRELREAVDPIDQATDLFNAIHWAMGEPLVDRDRVGLWGTSFSGGLVAYVAARDPRVKAFVSQVGYFGESPRGGDAAARQRAYADATRRARGELPFPEPGAHEIGNLRGAPLREKFLLYAPIDDVAGARGCAMLFIAAGREELFDNRRHPQLAFERAPEPKQYVVIPGISHYGIYGEAREQATRLAIDWFNRHLKKT
ncbi:MAG TPA: alpha/beta fold hydrolase [Burkholderiales bacterium]|nr:alpha/beta fold hydrolase [Burkholderiales bacterium]